MANPNDIELGITATGGDEAAAEIQKPTDALKEQTEAVDDLAGQTRRQAEANAEALVKREEQLKSFLQGAAAVAKFGNALKNAGPELETTFSPENAAKIRECGASLENVAGAATMAAEGFAVGGPLGAGIGALVGTLLPDLNAAFDDMIGTWAAIDAAAAENEKIQRQLNIAYSMGTEAYGAATKAAEDYQTATDNLTESLAKETAALKNRNKVLDAKDSADAAARDNADAAAIRGGAAPEDVEAARAKDDAAIKKAKIQRDLAAKFKDSQTAGYKLTQAKRGVEMETNDPTLRTQEERDNAIAKRKAARDAAQKVFDKSRSDFEAERDSAGYKIREVDTEAAGKVDDLAFSKAQRLKEEEAAAKKKADAAKKKADDEAKKAAKQAERDRLDRLESGLESSAKSGAAKIFGSPTASRNKTARGVGEALENGTSEEEIAKLTREVNAKSGVMGAAMVQALRKLLAGLEQQAKEIEVVKNQIKNKQ